MRIVSSSWLAGSGAARPSSSAHRQMSRTSEQKKRPHMRPFSGPEKLDRSAMIPAQQFKCQLRQSEQVTILPAFALGSPGCSPPNLRIFEQAQCRIMRNTHEGSGGVEQFLLVAIAALLVIAAVLSR
jgi:hypothetical protein